MWQVYILKCADGTLYTGITNDMDKRLAEHNSGKGAKYTRGRGPVKLVYAKKYGGRSEATKAEIEIKKLTVKDKLKLCERPL